LTITVESVDFDPNVGLLRINGKVASENQYVKVKSKKKKKKKKKVCECTTY
jgi:stalled ribosome rescue protein Dom34